MILDASWTYAHAPMNDSMSVGRLPPFMKSSMLPRMAAKNTVAKLLVDLGEACREYQDLTASRCAGLGACKTPNDPATCTAYTDRECADGGTAQSDAGGPGQQDAGTGGGTSSGCTAARGAGTPWPLLVTALLAVCARRRSRRTR